MLATIGLMGLSLITPTAQAVASEQAQQRLEYEQNTVEVVEQVVPAIVAVRISIDGERVDILPEGEQDVGGGSGFVVDESGEMS